MVKEKTKDSKFPDNKKILNVKRIPELLNKNHENFNILL